MAVEEYIAKHYADENLSQQLIADQFGISVNYLSYFFREQKNFVQKSCFSLFTNVPCCAILYLVRGALAQLVAHNTGSVGVSGSNPLCSTDSGILEKSRVPVFCCNAIIGFFRDCNLQINLTGVLSRNNSCFPRV